MKNHGLAFLQSVLIPVLLSGCSWLGDVSSNMRVDTGLEPQNIDSNVRFRTTYYFRVLTGCSIEPMKKGDRASDDSHFAKRVGGHFVPLNDSLYRFRMTGQAAALFNRVHFESGVLRKEQIDPFGSTVRYHEQTNSFLPVSADEIRADARNHIAKRDIQEFRELYKSIAADNGLTDEARKQLLAKLIEMLEERLDTVKRFRPLSTPSASVASVPVQPGSGDDSEKKLHALIAQLNDTTTKMNQAETSLKDAESKVQESQAHVDKIQKLLEEPKGEIKSSEGKLAESLKDNEELLKQLAAANKKLDEAKGELTAARKQVIDLTSKVAETKVQIETAQRELDAAKKASITSLQELSKKTDALLAELGAAKDIPLDQNAGTCNGRPSTTKYFLLGPEGAKELDPNDRLLLALSVDSKPLISALQKLSDKKSQVLGGNMKAMEDLLDERGRILDAKSVLQKSEKDADQELDKTDQLRSLLSELRKPYMSIFENTSVK